MPIIIDIIGAAIGLVYIVSEYRAGRLIWVWSLLMSLFYIVIYYLIDCYANCGISIYNFLMSVYGLLVWRGIIASKDKTPRRIGSCPRHLVPWVVLACVVLSVAFYFLLRALPNESSFPLLDGISSGLGIVAMWMLSQKYWQEWIPWLIVEPLLAYIFLRQGLYASALLYVIFEVFCILGLIRWRKEWKSDMAKPMADISSPEHYKYK